MDFEALSRQVLDWLTTNGLRLLVIIIITLIALKIASLLTKRLSNLLIKSRFEGEKQKRETNHQPYQAGHLDISPPHTTSGDNHN